MNYLLARKPAAPPHGEIDAELLRQKTSGVDGEAAATQRPQTPVISIEGGLPCIRSSWPRAHARLGAALSESQLGIGREDNVATPRLTQFMPEPTGSPRLTRFLPPQAESAQDATP